MLGQFCLRPEKPQPQGRIPFTLSSRHVSEAAVGRISAYPEVSQLSIEE